jgi:tRNA (cytidine/uridine-2'-O-)-methyltransferase
VNIVLYEPDIPFNTGNVGRTCVATGSTLHLVGRLGFSIDAAQVKRAGLDYWEKVQLLQHVDWEAFLAQLPPDAPLYFFSKKVSRPFWDAEFKPDSYLIFGCETKGLPDALMTRYADRSWTIPMQPDSVRSLNLSVSAGVVLYEALRQTRALPASV